MVLGNRFLVQSPASVVILAPQLLSGECFSCILLLSLSVPALQKQLPTFCGFSLPQFTFLHQVPAKFCGTSYAEHYVNLQVNFLCSKWFGADLAAFQGQDKLRISMLLCHLDPFHSPNQFKNFFLLTVDF